MRVTRPLFLFDPGWLFVLGGLVVCAVGVLLPAQADLRALEQQLAQLQSEEARAYQRLAAHADFIDQVENSDPAIIKRLAAAQLNVVPEGDKPLLLSSIDASPVTEWIDATVELDIRPPQPELASTLSRWASGPSRLWMFGGGIMAVFIGLLITPGTMRKAREVGVAEAMIHTAAQQWRSGALGRDMLGQPLLSSSDDPSRQQLLWESIEDDASQRADTVDLEEIELIPSRRSVIEDDAQDALDDECSADVMIEAKELTGADIGDAGKATDDAGVGIESEAVAFMEEGLGRDEAAMLLADQLTAGTGLLEQVEWNPVAAKDHTTADAEADGEGTPEIVIEPPAALESVVSKREPAAGQKRRRARKASPLTQPLEAAAETIADEATAKAETGDDTLPRAGDTVKSTNAAPYESIPFLRFRRNAEHDDPCDGSTDETVTARGAGDDDGGSRAAEIHVDGSREAESEHERESDGSRHKFRRR